MMSPDDSSSIQFGIMKRFPLLVPTTSNFTSYDGFIEVKGILFRVHLNVPNYPAVKDIVFQSEWKLSELLKKHEQFFSDCANVEMMLSQFLSQLEILITNSLETEAHTHLALEEDRVALAGEENSLQHYATVLSEMKEVGTDHIEALSSDFKTVSLHANDANGDLHVLTLKLSDNYCHESTGKHNFEVTDTDLPEAIINLIQKEASIVRGFRLFCEQITCLSGMWKSLATIDRSCWVIDPIHPRRADIYRRIFLSPPSVMAQLSWDPLKPNQPPELKFQGADAEVEDLRSTYEEHLENWDQACGILDNLCSVLQLTSLPQAPAVDKQAVSQTVETGECSICYTIQNEGKLPEESCGKCLASFHTACLYEWLQMMPGSRQVHGHISGPCPNCESTMKCPCPHEMA